MDQQPLSFVFDFAVCGIGSQAKSYLPFRLRAYTKGYPFAERSSTILDISLPERGVAFDLLRKNSTLQAVSKYLDNKGLPASSPSWPIVFERLASMLVDGRLERSDLLRMLRDAEEYGRQHIFLHSCNKREAIALLNETTLAANLAKLDLTEIAEKPKIVGSVKGLQLVEARIDTPKRGMRALVIKAVDVHSYRERESKVVDGDREIETYLWQHDRVVDLISVREDGLLEVRIQSRRNAVKYEDLAENLFAKATGIIERIKFPAISLAKARIMLIQKRTQMGHIVRFADNQLRDKEGNSISMASGSRQQELYTKGSASDKAVDGFLSVGTPMCDEIDCFWITRKGSPEPSTELHTLIGGANHEFALTAQCDRKDYEYALAQILNLTR